MVQRERVRESKEGEFVLLPQSSTCSQMLCVFPLLPTFFAPASLFSSLLLPLYLSFCCHTALPHALPLNFAHCLLSVSDLSFC